MSRNSILSMLMVLLLNFTLSGKTFIELNTNLLENNSTELISIAKKPNPPGDLLEFIDAPADITIDCGTTYDFVPSLAANCGSVSDVMVVETIIDAAPDCPAVLIYQRVYTATDTCEHSISHTQQITIEDNTPPVVICPGDISIDCFGDLPDPTIVATDDCDEDLDIFFNEFFVGTDGAVADTCFLFDAVGLSPNYWAFWVPGLPLGLPDRYVFFDGEPGQFTRSGSTAHFTGRVHAIVGLVPDTNKVFEFDLMVKDRLNWDQWSALLTISPPPIFRSFKDAPENATDNLLFQTWDYYVIDETASTLTGKNDYEGTVFNLSHQPSSLFYGFQVGLAANNKNDEFGMSAWFDYIGDLIYLGDTLAAGGFGDVNFESECGPGLVACENDLVRRWTIIDDCGNFTTCEQLIHVEDSVPPVFDFCPPDITLGCTDPIPTPPVLTGTDNCADTLTFTTVDEQIGEGCNYVINRIFTLEDDCDNRTSKTQVITIQDIIPPVITCPEELLMECNADLPAPNIDLITATDNCPGDITIAFVGDVELSSGCLLIIERTYSATDVCGNESTCSYLISIPTDSSAPVLTCPGDITLVCNSPVPPADPGEVTKTDDCSSSQTVIHEGDVTIQQGCLLVIERTYSGSDNCGNIGFCSYTITIPTDTEPPVVFCPSDATLECNTDAPSSNTGLLDGSDACGIDFFSFEGDTENIVNCVKTVSRTYSATDFCDNTGFCTQTFTIPWDNEPPVITCPADVTLPCNSQDPGIDLDSVTATDNCGVPTISHVVTALGGGPCIQIILQTYKATDDCGNESLCDQLITIPSDFEDPLVSCPPDAALACNSEAPAPNTDLVTATDNCEIDFKSYEGDTESIANCVKTVTRNYSATDLCENTSSCTQTFTIPWDSEPPVIVCPSDVTLACNAAIPDSDIGLPTASDNCPGLITISFLEDDAIVDGCNLIITRTYRATDACGNVADCFQTITIPTDNEAPVITCPEDIFLKCNAELPPVDISLVSVSDNCPGAVTVVHGGDLVISTGSCLLVVQRTYTATDACGNQSSCSYLISIPTDIVPPVLTCPGDLTLECNSPVPPANPGGVTKTDNCSSSQVVDHVGDSIIFQGGCLTIILRTYSGSDNCGNVGFCSQTITIPTDFVNPIVVCPPNATLECNADTPAPNTQLLGVSDACGNDFFSFEGDSEDIVNCMKTVTRTYSATDLCGNQGFCTQTFTIPWDSEPPVVSNPPVDLTIECTESYPAYIPEWTDNCPGDIEEEAISAISSPGCTQYVSQVFYATDACGNEASVSRSITIVDTQAPVLQNPPVDVTIECGDPVPTYEPIWEDECDNGLDLTAIGGTGMDGCNEIQFFTYSAADTCGNSNSVNWSITIIDSTPPDIQACTGNYTLPCNSPLPPAETSSVIATDNCDIDLTITSDDVTLSEGCLLVIERTYYVTDDCNNQSTCSHTITIPTDTEPPVVSNPPVDLTIECTESYPAYIPEWTDNCPGDIEEEAISAISSPGCTQYVSQVFYATDACGNEASVSRSITIVDTQAPVLQNPPVDVTIECGDPVPTYEPIWEDECDNGLDLTAIGGTGMDGCNEIQFFTYSAADTCGNSNSVNWSITIIDSTPPDIQACTGNYTLPCNSPLPPAETSSVIATDNCNIDLTITSEDVTLSEGCLLVIERTYYVTDDCDNQSTCSHTITIPTDTEPPVVSNPPVDLTIECTESYPAYIPEWTDNCPGDIEEEAISAISSPGCTQYVSQVFYATDACGNEASVSRSITIVDTQAPVLQNPPVDVTIECGDPVPTYEPIWEGECDNGLDLTAIGGTGMDGCNEIQFFTYSAADTCGNSNSVNWSITILDTTPPDIQACTGNYTLPCNSPLPPAETSSVIATDNCDIDLTITSDDVTLSEGCLLVIERTYYVTDDCNNQSTCSHTITIPTDTELPVVTCPDDLTLACNSNIPPIDIASVSATDNCPGQLVIEHVEDDLVYLDCVLIVTRTYKATDECGNVGYCFQSITIPQDTQVPTISCPDDLILPCNSNLPPADIAEVIASDNCPGDLTIVHEDDVTLSEGCLLVILRTYSATDACGNRSTCSYTISIPTDTNVPFITCPPDLIDLPCNSEIPPVDLESVTAIDQCGKPVVTHDGDDTFMDGCDQITNRTYRATDNCGNFNTCVQQIIIRIDNDAPVLETVLADITMSCMDVVPDPPAVVFTDNCGDPDVVFDEDTNNQDCGSEITRTWTATDECGNSTIATQTITITDDVPPVLVPPVLLTVTKTCEEINIDLIISYLDGTISPADELALLEALEELFSDCDLVPTATDECSDSWVIKTDLIIQGFQTIKFPQVGFIECHFIAMDACGNTSEELVTQIIIDDEIFPEALCQDIVVVLDSDGSATITPEMLDGGSSDNCGPAYLTLLEDTFDCDDVGQKVIPLYVTDLGGNLSFCTANVTILDNGLSGLVCPGDLTVGTDHPQVCISHVNGLIAYAANACEELVLSNDSEYAYNSGADASGIYPLGTHIITWTGDDGNGTVFTCSTTLIVEDQTNPNALCKNITATLNNHEVTIPAFVINNGSYDNCDANQVTFLIDGEASLDFGCDAVGNPQQVTLTVTDGSGNSSTCTSIVTVQDNSVPVINCPSDLTLNMGDCGVTEVNLDPIDVSDNCLVSVTNDSPYANSGGADISGSYPIGTTTVTLAAIDAANNSANCSFSITVLGYPAPENLESIFLGDAYVLSWDPVPASTVCQIIGGPQGGGDNASLIIWGNEPSSKYIPMGSLQVGESYQWKVKCACSTNPLIVSNFSVYDIFTVPLNPGTDLLPPGEVVEKSIDVKGNVVSVYPNPNRGEFYVQTDLEQYNIKVMDITGKEVLSIGEINTQLYLIELDDVERGIYFVRVMNSDFQEVIKVVID